jgi:DNA-binding NtrC family response regulator
VLEDEYFVADDLVRALRDGGAQAVGPVNTVRQAEEIVAREHLDGAILDLNLRGQMAFDFVRRLAATELPCLIVSGYGEDAVPDAVSHIARIEKPVSAAFVVKTLAAEMERGH